MTYRAPFPPLRLLFVSLFLIGFAGTLAHAQNFVERWQDRVNRTQAEQPKWVTPLVTITPRLEQEFRADFTRQITPRLFDAWNFGNGKGLELIPARRIELIANVPPYLQHNQPKVKDGFGDVSFLMKYRIYASNEEKHNAILTAFFAGSVPTGSYSNGAPNATVTPTVAGGKGYGHFDVQSTIGAVLPVADGAKLGRPVSWNTAVQYKAGFAWPEIESNATWFHGGPNDGRMQNFVTPGVITRFPLHNRLKLVLGAGIQIATSGFHTYNHGLVFTGRLPF